MSAGIDANSGSAATVPVAGFPIVGPALAQGRIEIVGLPSGQDQIDIRSAASSFAKATADKSGDPTLAFRWLISVFVLLSLFVGTSAAHAAEPAAKDDQVIFPRVTGADATAAAGRTGGASPLLLVVAIGAAGIGGWLLWRQRRTPAGMTGREGRKLAVVESRGLGNRQYLVVADYDGQKFLLGVCPGRIEMLSKLGHRAPGEERGA